MITKTENFLLAPTAQSATHQSSSIQLGHWYQSNMPTMQKCSGNSGPHLHSLLLLPIGLDSATRLLREAAAILLHVQLVLAPGFRLRSHCGDSDLLVPMEIKEQIYI
ncbi:hypothetical protein MRB53_003833 [Persea americana]|uniref:Uncharacterized protein n=1 Tax=Persea americana TaxID=3435 RepID=A0ACC2MZC0_PERAE|nr:hypothetical protein MRB53_003833 [Persea americana]